MIGDWLNRHFRQWTDVSCLTALTINPLMPTCHMGTAIKHPVPDQVKQSFVIFDIRAL